MLCSMCGPRGVFLDKLCPVCCSCIHICRGANANPCRNVPDHETTGGFSLASHLIHDHHAPPALVWNGRQRQRISMHAIAHLRERANLA